MFMMIGLSIVVQTDVLAIASFIPLGVKDSSLLRYADSSLEVVLVMVQMQGTTYLV